MKTIQFYKISALILLLLNIILIGFLFFTPPKPPHHEGNNFLNEVIETLQLNEKQIEMFEKIAMQHNQDMEAVQDNQLEWTQAYFQEKNNSTTSDSLLNLIKEAETKKIIITKNHFEDVKNILTDSQLSNYEDFRKNALDKILLKKMPRPKR